MKALSCESMIQKNVEISFILLDGELVLMGVRDLLYYRINSSGICIWNFLDKAYSLNEIITFVANHYDMEPHQVREDVESFIALMIEKEVFQLV